MMAKKSIKRLTGFMKVFFALLLIVLVIFSRQIEAKATENTGNTSTTTQGNTNNSSDGNNILGIDITSNGESGTLTGALQIVLVLTVLALCPSILIMLTSFTRILIVLHFTRAALNTQSAPPNQVLIGMALFLTFFIMSPIFSNVYTDAIRPLSKGEITQTEALEKGAAPIKRFMLNNVKDKDLNAMCEIAGISEVNMENIEEEIPISVLIPSFILSELRVAFWIGFLIYIPFIIIDMVVASVLMSMGMMMLPPTTISMPFKILLFVLADGWNLIIVNLMKTFIV